MLTVTSKVPLGGVWAAGLMMVSMPPCWNTIRNWRAGSNPVPVTFTDPPGTTCVVLSCVIRGLKGVGVGGGGGGGVAVGVGVGVGVGDGLGEGLGETVTLCVAGQEPLQQA
jgi:hypothetical protein